MSAGPHAPGAVGFARRALVVWAGVNILVVTALVLTRLAEPAWTGPWALALALAMTASTCVAGSCFWLVERRTAARADRAAAGD